MRNFCLALGAILLISLGAGCSGGDGNKTATPEDATYSPPTELAGTLTASGTVSALRTLSAGGLTPLANGTVVTPDGVPVPADVATRAAEAATAAPPPPIGEPTLAPGAPTSTEAPLCVLDPTVPGCSTPPPVSTPIAPGAQGIAIDSNVSTPNVDGGPVNAGGGQNFVVGINIVTVPQPYQGYEWDLVMDGPIKFVSSVPDKPAGLTLCSDPTPAPPANDIYSGCLSTDKNVTFTGRVDTVTLQCTGPGSGQLHLRKQGEGGPFGTDLLNSQAEPITGEVGPAIQVTCT